MKILVPTKSVPDPDHRVRINDAGTGIDEKGVPFVINPFDAIALEEALRIREQAGVGVEILAVGIGPERCESELRTALAMGAERGLHVLTAEPLDPWNVARLLAAIVRRETPDLVLMGKQAVDDDSSQAGQFLAALLDWPQATFASRIEFVTAWDESPLISGATVRVSRETDLGLETLELDLPAVVTADLRLNEPRYASLPSLMRARKKPIEQLTATELQVTLEPRLEVLRLESATVQQTCVRVQDVDELVRRLRDEAKVL